jgi:hypothetical protein
MLDRSDNVMSVIGEAGYVLTKKELVFLAALTGAEEMYGIEDNSFKMSDKEISEEWDKAKDQLETKKYIEVDFDNSVTMDDDLFSLIVACCNPKVFLRTVRIEDNDCVNMRNIYITKDIAVELDRDRLSKNKYVMTPLVSIEKVAANLLECFVTEKDYTGENMSFDIHVTDFEKLNNFLEKSETSAAIELMKNLGCNEDGAEDFIGAIKTKELCTSLLVMLIDYDNMSDVISYSYYSGCNYLWRVDVSNLGKEEEEEKIITLSTVSSESALKEIEKMVLSLKHLYSSAARKGDGVNG